MSAAPISFTFDSCPGEHARVTSLLIHEQFSSELWRILKWAVVLVLVLSATLTIAAAAVGDLNCTVRLGPLTLVVAGLTWKLPILTGRLQAWRVRRSDPNVAHPITHTLDDSGLHIGMRTFNAELKWAGMNRVGETPDRRNTRDVSLLLQSAHDILPPQARG